MLRAQPALLFWAAAGAAARWLKPTRPNRARRIGNVGFTAASISRLTARFNDMSALFVRAARSGYTGVLLSDYKLQVLDRVTDNYFRNVEKVKLAALHARLELIPAVFSIGYSNGHLSHDPNLAEGLPVVDQPYLVKGGKAVLDSETAGRAQERQSRTRQRRPVRGLFVPRRPWGGDVRRSHGRSRRPNLVPGRARGAGPPSVPSPNARLAQRAALRRAPPTASRAGSRPVILPPRVRFICSPWCKPRRPPAHLSRRGSRADPGLEKARSRLQQPRSKRGQSLCRLLGRGQGDVLGRRHRARRARACEHPQARRLPARREIGRSLSYIHRGSRLRAGR